MICVNIINGKRKIGNWKSLWLEYAVSLIFPFLKASDNGIEFTFLHHKCYTAQNSLINSSNVCISYHAAQNKSWSRHQNIVTLPISYVNKSTSNVPIFHIKSV